MIAIYQILIDFYSCTSLLFSFFFNIIFLLNSYIFNGRTLDLEKTMYQNIYNSFGLKKNTLKLFSERFEGDVHQNLSNLSKYKLDLYTTLLYEVIPYRCDLKKKLTMNIFILDVITTYRGWRHFKGLPVRGQRTWTNAWSNYRSNWLLRNYKMNSFKNNYVNVPQKDVKVATIAEYVNLTWKQQWDYEWLSAKNSRLQFKGNKNTIRIDIYAMANYQVMHPLKLKNLSKKQKQSFKKNYFSLGFDLGFTKYLLQDMYEESNSLNGLSKNSLIFKDHRLNKKNSPKKKVEVNKNQKKKVKKSVWD